jgi:hypothetical protein
MIRAFVALVLLSGENVVVHAADIQASTDKLCAFKLEGKIIAGDYDHLAILIAHSHLDPLDERTATICLKSNGGSYDEGVKLAELIYNSGMSTLVADGSECFSACATVFMAGVMPEQAAPYRKLSARGVLGFHAPYLSVSDGKYSKEEIEQATQGIRLAILGLMQLSSKKTKLSSTDFIKKSLIAEVLKKGPQDIFLIKTISQAARWNIEIYDYAEQFPKANNVDGIKNLCNNFHYVNMDEPVPVGRDYLLKVDKYASKYDKNNVRILVQDVKTKDTVCEVYPIVFKGSPEELDFSACSYDYWSDKSFGDCREYKTRPAALIGRPVPRFFNSCACHGAKAIPIGASHERLHAKTW